MCLIKGGKYSKGEGFIIMDKRQPQINFVKKKNNFCKMKYELYSFLI